MVKAFTLIELLVVVAIIGILAAVGVTTFNGFQEKAKKSMCKQNANFFKKEIMKKWINAQFQNGPDIDFQGGICRLHWLPSNAHLNSDPGTNIASNMKKNRTTHIQCDSNYEGKEHFVNDHFYGLGYRNTIIGDPITALDTPGRGNVLREGGSHFACGANAGFTDPRKCKLRTMCELNQTEETILYKD